MFLGPLVSPLSHRCCLRTKAWIVSLVRFEDSGCISHHSSKVESGCDALGNNISGLLTICWHDETLEVRRCQFVVDSAIVRILHGKEPAQIEHHFVKEIGSLIAALGDMGIELSKILGELLVGNKHQPNAEGRIHHIFVVVASIVPAIG